MFWLDFIISCRSSRSRVVGFSSMSHCSLSEIFMLRDNQEAGMKLAGHGIG